MSKKFRHLDLSPHWQQYFSKYPQGYTIIENLIDWVSQVDDMVDNQNTLNNTVNTFGDRLDEFIGQYDTHLQETVEETLSDWQHSGFLDVVIDNALETKFHEMDNRLTTQLDDTDNDLLQRGVNVNNYEHLVVDGDWTHAIQTAINETPENSILLFNKEAPYKTTDTIVCDKDISLHMETAIELDSLENVPALIIGEGGSDNSHRNQIHKLRVKRKSLTNWLNHNDVGIRLINFFSNEVHILELENFTVGANLLGDNHGFGHNIFHITDTINNKIHLKLESNRANGWVNENLYLGGRFTNFEGGLPDSGDPSGRRAVLITSRDGLYTLNDSNVFMKPCFQVHGGKGVEIEHGTNNHFVDVRSETNGEGTELAVFKNRARNNTIDVLYAHTRTDHVSYDYTDESEFPVSNIVRFNSMLDIHEAKREVFNANNFVDELEKTDSYLSFMRLMGDTSTTPPIQTSEYDPERVMLHENYVELDQYTIGTTVDTSTIKNLTVFVGALEDSDHRIMVRAFSENGEIIRNTDFKGTVRPAERLRIYTHGTHRTEIAINRLSFQVPKEIKKVWVGVGSYLQPSKIYGLQIYTRDSGFFRVSKD